MLNEELKPCPFCGGDAEIVNIEEGENAGGSCVCCTRCMASSNVEFEFKENFVSNWNRRAYLSTVEKQVGEWAIDNSTPSPILTYENCSVIQDEQAYYVLDLVRNAASTPPASATKGEKR